MPPEYAGQRNNLDNASHALALCCQKVPWPVTGLGALAPAASAGAVLTRAGVSETATGDAVRAAVQRCACW